jgi:hypothetical protein
MLFPDLDIFCTVVDNYGDVGFSYRFARSYQERHPQTQVRLFVDKPEALKKIMDPVAAKNFSQLHIYPFIDIPTTAAPLVIETFGSNIPEAYIEKMKTDTKLWINIEYLSAENWITTVHGQASPQNNPGLKKLFYMPGFSAKTGGVLTDFTAAVTATTNTISVFTYRQDFSVLLKNLPPSRLLIFDTYAQDILSLQQNQFPQHTFIMQPFVTQDAYDTILAESKLNLVRGEESLVRAILSGKPFLWQAYPQDNDHQLVKIDAFLEIFKQYFAEPTLFAVYRTIMRSWNGDMTPLTVDNWRVFLENLPAIEIATQAFGNYLRQNCDMGLLFDKFITKNW